MYFKVYHKKSKQALATFDEKTIVDFCIKNKDSLRNYYFSTGGYKDLMEWDVFTVKHSELFEKKAEERDQKEFGTSDEEEITVKKKRRGSTFAIILLVLLITSYSTYYLYQEKVEQDINLAKAAESKEISAKENRETIEKRPTNKSDANFTAIMPKEEELIKLWDKSKDKKIKNSLDLNDIKNQMDSYLPQLKECYIKRTKAGDKGLRGTINLKIRISGDGIVRDVVLTDEKYRSTLFGDCIISAVKSKKFKVFKSREQVFSYYWNF